MSQSITGSAHHSIQIDNEPEPDVSNANTPDPNVALAPPTESTDNAKAPDPNVALVPPTKTTDNASKLTAFLLALQRAFFNSALNPKPEPQQYYQACSTQMNVIAGGLLAGSSAALLLDKTPSATFQMSIIIAFACSLTCMVLNYFVAAIASIDKELQQQRADRLTNWAGVCCIGSGASWCVAILVTLSDNTPILISTTMLFVLPPVIVMIFVFRKGWVDL